MAERDTQAVAAIGRRLQFYFHHLGLNQSQATKLLGLSPQVLANISAGSNTAGKTIIRIATTFPKLHLDWLLHGTEPMTQEADFPVVDRAAALRSTVLSLQGEPLAKTANAQKAQADQWAVLFDQALTERLELMALFADMQGQIIDQITIAE